MSKAGFVGTLVSTLLLVSSLQSAAQGGWNTKKILHIGGEGAWDYVTVDSAAHLLFLPRATHTQVVNTVSGKVVGDIPGQVRSHGVALVPELGRGFITDGGAAGEVLVFDLKTYAVLGTLDAMPDSDGIIYDASTKLVLAVSGDGAAFPGHQGDGHHVCRYH